MRENLLIDKSIAFAARIIKLHKYLIRTQKETIISKQIVRSGTSIGANINEANYGQSKADFISKLHIALKEAAETEYWLRLLLASEYISEELGDSMLKDCLELKRILIASINTEKAIQTECHLSCFKHTGIDKRRKALVDFFDSRFTLRYHFGVNCEEGK